MSNAQLKEWVRLSHSPSNTTATVSLVEGNLSVRWSVKTFPSTLKEGVRDARAGAVRAMEDLKLALAALEEEAA